MFCIKLVSTINSIMIEFFSDPMIFSFSFIITSVLSFDFVLDGFLICNFFVTTCPYAGVRCHNSWGKLTQHYISQAAIL